MGRAAASTMGTHHPFRRVIVRAIFSPKLDRRLGVRETVAADASAPHAGAVLGAEVERENVVPVAKEKQMPARDGTVAEHPADPTVEAIERATENDAVVERPDRHFDRCAGAGALKGQTDLLRRAAPKQAGRSLRAARVVGLEREIRLRDCPRLPATRGALASLLRDGGWRRREAADDVAPDPHGARRVDGPPGPVIVREDGHACLEVDQPEDPGIWVVVEQPDQDCRQMAVPDPTSSVSTRSRSRCEPRTA